jgi:hypothetical protein
MGINVTLAELVTAVVSVGALQALVSWLLKAQLESSLKHHYDRRLEDLKFDIRKREQAARIAELLAEWASKPSDTRRLNQLCWEASLWLPESVARDLARTFLYQAGAKSTQELLIEVRKIINGGSDGLRSDEIIHFPSRPVSPQNAPGR